MYVNDGLNIYLFLKSMHWPDIFAIDRKWNIHFIELFLLDQQMDFSYILINFLSSEQNSLQFKLCCCFSFCPFPPVHSTIFSLNYVDRLVVSMGSEERNSFGFVIIYRSAEWESRYGIGCIDIRFHKLSIISFRCFHSIEFVSGSPEKAREEFIEQ